MAIQPCRSVRIIKSLYPKTSTLKIASYLKSLEEQARPSKAMLSESGWIYLINDSANFMHYLLGLRKWSDDDAEIAASTMKERLDKIGLSKSTYVKFIIPEKAVIYPEFLPKSIRDVKFERARPARLLSEIESNNVYYLDEPLRSRKPAGALYFRGDSHTNWLGSFVAYTEIIRNLNKVLKKCGHKIKPSISFKHLTPFLASYGGDLYTQLNLEDQEILKKYNEELNFENSLEKLVGYNLAEETRTTERVNVPREYLEKVENREFFKFINRDQQLPKAVVFRDSTSQHIIELISEHFSECLFIWRDGHIFKDIIEKEKPDIVVHIMAERFVSAYPKMNALT